MLVRGPAARRLLIGSATAGILAVVVYVLGLSQARRAAATTA